MTGLNLTQGLGVIAIKFSHTSVSMQAHRPSGDHRPGSKGPVGSLKGSFEGLKAERPRKRQAPAAEQKTQTQQPGHRCYR